MLTFAVVAARPGRAMPPRVGELLGQPAPDRLAYTPHAHVSWTSPDGRVRVAVWQDRDLLGIGRRWDVRPSGFTAFGGMAWHRATPWATTSSWASQLADLFERVPLRDAVADLDGRFVAVSVGADGTGAVTADPFGMTGLFRAEGDDVVVASNRSVLAASLATPTGREPARDRDAMAWLVLGGTIMEGRSGFEGVRRVPDGTLLELTPDRPLDLVTWDALPWWAGPPVAASERADVIAEAGDHMRALLRAQVAVPSMRRTMNLSGGHDSRVVLALLLQEGLQHELSYLTWGDESLPDVVVATSLAERYQLDHDGPGQARPDHRPRPAFGPCPPDATDDDPAARVEAPGFVAAARHHCWATSAVLSLWDRTLGLGQPIPRVSITGDLGEMLRPRHPAGAGFASLDEIRAALDAGWLRLDPAGLLHREVRADLFGRVIEQVAGAWGDGASAQDALDGYYYRNRLRPWSGGMGEHDQRNPISPLGARRAVRAAFAVGPDARRDELLAFTLVRAADPDLARHPFAGKSWPAAVVAGLDDADTYPTTPVGARWSPPKQLDPIAALRQRRAANRSKTVRDEQRQASFAADLAGLAELVDLGPGHALFDLVDRRAVQRALRRGDTAYAQRRALFDLATAAIWLDRGEAEVPGLSRR